MKNTASPHDVKTEVKNIMNWSSRVQPPFVAGVQVEELAEPPGREQGPFTEQAPKAVREPQAAEATPVRSTEEENPTDYGAVESADAEAADGLLAGSRVLLDRAEAGCAEAAAVSKALANNVGLFL